MRENGVIHANVVINNNYVRGALLGCQAEVEAILSHGSTMTVWHQGCGKSLSPPGKGMKLDS
ncbi:MULTISPECIES: DddA-like double-stranded DNA deaminase toxin [unclassified Nonomuraea]|uniref:DddA-like double-stranded DNA deaminase toxin n=1 Tax=unclassified Nonomuraea TaxID=2593643 RepID=UPI0033CE7555